MACAIIPGMIARLFSGVVQGIRGELVAVELEASPGLPDFSAIGSSDPIVKEAKHRVTSALRSIGEDLPPRKIIVNLAPASLPKRGTAFDLPIAIAILQANGKIDPLTTSETCLLGELALDGALRPCRGVIPVGMTAMMNGISSLIIPSQNSEEASCLPNLDIYVADHLKQVVDHFRGKEELPKVKNNSIR